MPDTSLTLDLERVKKEAQEAAFYYDHLDDACPYPFCTVAGQVFKDAFLAAQQAQKAVQHG